MLPRRGFVALCNAQALLESMVVYYAGTREVPLGNMDIACPLLAISTNFLRICLLVVWLSHVERRLARRGGAGGDDPKWRCHCALALWFVSSLLLCMWDCAMAAQCEAPTTARALAALSLVNLALCTAWLLLLFSPAKGEKAAEEKAAEAVSQPPPVDFGELANAKALRFGSVCAICLAGMKKGETVGLLACGHAFHEACIRAWTCEGEEWQCPMRCGAPVAEAPKGGHGPRVAAAGQDAFGGGFANVV